MLHATEPEEVVPHDKEGKRPVEATLLEGEIAGKSLPLEDFSNALPDGLTMVALNAPKELDRLGDEVAQDEPRLAASPPKSIMSAEAEWFRGMPARLGGVGGGSATLRLDVAT